MILSHSQYILSPQPGGGGDKFKVHIYETIKHNIGTIKMQNAELEHCSIHSCLIQLFLLRTRPLLESRLVIM